MADLHILVAEDDAVLRDLYVKKFRLSGYDVRTAENGQEALQMLEKEAPDLLLLDLHMPMMDGFQVLEALPKKRQYGVVVLTNFADDVSRSRAEELGADAFCVKKDLTIKLLTETVVSMAKKHKKA